MKYVEADSDEEEKEKLLLNQKRKLNLNKTGTTIPQKELSCNEFLCPTSLGKVQNRIMIERAKR